MRVPVALEGEVAEDEKGVAELRTEAHVVYIGVKNDLLEAVKPLVVTLTGP
ncbi:hypothetical protein GCM10011379_22730 [Filimonas zeae]|uniref:Uncharacterized protein n=1 Tax=Filimonas zeae TaxID=1737353 RepID=A0A917MW87_9BACT|nr:hypothetical protein GCM10011379_22730 [Filimonas zeae]